MFGVLVKSKESVQMRTRFAVWLRSYSKVIIIQLTAFRKIDAWKATSLTWSLFKISKFFRGLWSYCWLGCFLVDENIVPSSPIQLPTQFPFPCFPYYILCQTHPVLQKGPLMLPLSFQEISTTFVLRWSSNRISWLPRHWNALWDTLGRGVFPLSQLHAVRGEGRGAIWPNYSTIATEVKL